MGVGTPDDMLEAVARGVDMFDCVMPTRNGRHGMAFTRFGQINLRNARHADDPRPLDEDKPMAVGAQATSRAYLHHLVRSGETLGAMLLSEINIAYYQHLMHDIRDAIAQGTFADFRDAHAPNGRRATSRRAEMRTVLFRSKRSVCSTSPSLICRVLSCRRIASARAWSRNRSRRCRRSRDS